jgi:hypothetical protein
VRRACGMCGRASDRHCHGNRGPHRPMCRRQRTPIRGKNPAAIAPDRLIPFGPRDQLWGRQERGRPPRLRAPLAAVESSVHYSRWRGGGGWRIMIFWWLGANIVMPQPTPSRCRRQGRRVGGKPRVRKHGIHRGAHNHLSRFRTLSLSSHLTHLLRPRQGDAPRCSMFSAIPSQCSGVESNGFGPTSHSRRRPQHSCTPDK